MIKKWIAFSIVSSVLLSFAACESREDKALQAAQEQYGIAAGEAERAKQEYEDLNRSIAELNSLHDAINNNRG